MLFNPLIPFWLITPIVTLVFIFLVWLESKKPYRFQIFRIISLVLVMLALTGLLFKPSYQIKKSSRIILLTANYSTVLVDSTLTKHPDLMLMHLEETAPYKNSTRLFMRSFQNEPRKLKS